MNENLAIDGNTKNTLGAVTNDVNQFIRRLRLNPVSGALLCEASITSSNTMIGSTIPGAIEGSVLFAGPGGTLAQDNTYFFWDDTDHFLGLGTNAPAATLHVSGSAEFDLGSDETGDIYYRGPSGALVNLNPGTDGQVLTLVAGLPDWQSGGGSSGVTRIIAGTDITISPSGGTGNVTVSVDTGALALDPTFISNLLANDSFMQGIADSSSFVTELVSNTAFLSDLANSTTFVNDLIANSTFTTNLANNANFYSALASNTSFISDLTSNSTFQSDIITVINGSGSLSVNLSSQVTGVLPVSHGGTGDSSLTAYAPIFGGTTTTGAVQSGTVGTSGQVLTSNGAGALPTFQSPPGSGNKIATSTSVITTSGSYTISVPGGKLGTSNGIRYKMLLNTAFFATSQAITVSATYGGTSVGSVTITNTSGGGVSSGATMEGYIIADGATNAQKGHLEFGSRIFTGYTLNTANATAAVDSTTSQNLVITITVGATSTMGSNGYVVESIS